jgi:hypothetical protein
MANRTAFFESRRATQQASTSAVYGVWSFGRWGLGFQYKNGTEHRFAVGETLLLFVLLQATIKGYVRELEIWSSVAGAK